MAIKAGQLREKEDFQKLILEYLENENGYIIRDSKNFNAGLAMDTDILFKFLNDTQADEVEALRRLYGEQTEETIINYLNNEINKDYRSLIDVLKNGIEFDTGVKLNLMYRKPATTFNKEAIENYGKNIFSVMEEVYHKKDERVDLVIFLNGLAIATFELKCNTSGQNYEDAIRQYKFERDFKNGTGNYNFDVEILLKNGKTLTI